jgi:ankyrin repeat protein
MWFKCSIPQFLLVQVFFLLQVEIFAQEADKALFKSLADGDATAMKLALSRGANPNATDASSASALMFAAAKNQPKMVEMLIQAGANINYKDKTGNTALIWASFRGCTEAVEALLKFKPDLEITSSSGATALHAAAARGFLPVVGETGTWRCKHQCT